MKALLLTFSLLGGLSAFAQPSGEGIGGSGSPAQTKPADSAPAQANTKPLCDIIELGSTGFAIMKGSSVLNGGISRDGAFQKLELYTKNGECVTNHKRKCFFVDMKGGRTIGFEGGAGGKSVILGLAFGSTELAIDRINKAKALGLCDEIVDKGFIK